MADEFEIRASIKSELEKYCDSRRKQKAPLWGHCKECPLSSNGLCLKIIIRHGDWYLLKTWRAGRP